VVGTLRKRVPTTTTPCTMGVSPPVQAILAARIDRLPAEHKRLL
jgi:hypothetical protein